MEDVDLHHRRIYDGEDADDEESSLDDYEEGSYPDGRNEEQGTFRYNKRILLISLPCFLLVVTLTGELLLCIVGISITMVTVLHNYGEHERNLIVFMVSFLLAQITILYTVLPLLWMSLWNIFVIGLVNAYTVVTGCWLAIQLPSFRNQATDSLQFIEKALFSVYPGVCVTLWTWALCFVFLPIKFAPFIFLVFAFVVLQLFLVPAESSFRLPKPIVTDGQVVDPVLFGLLVVTFCISPSAVHFGVTALKFQTIPDMMQPLIQEGFILAASVFLTTFLGLRKFMDDIGWPYSLVIKARWISGLLLAVMTSPLLWGMGATSSLLSWLPVVVAAYCCYGISLSYRKYKMMSFLCVSILVCLHIYNVGWLPWRLEYFVPSAGLHISFVYVLVLLNALMCLLFVYLSTHGNTQIIGTLITLQTIETSVLNLKWRKVDPPVCLCVTTFSNTVFTSTEICLRLLGLYSVTMLICTGAVGSYIFIRLFQVKKLQWIPAWLVASCHMTKMVVCLLNVVLSDLIGFSINTCIALYCLTGIFLIIFMFDGELTPTENQYYSFIGILYSVIGYNVSAICPGIWQSTFQFYPSATDLIGTWLVLTGIIIFVLFHIFSPSPPLLHYCGPLSLVMGAVVILLQPDTANPVLILKFWGSVLAVPALCLVFYCGPYSSLKGIISIGCSLALFPSALMVSLIYPVDEVSLFLYIIWFSTTSVIIALYIIIYKSDFSIVNTEKYTLYFCSLAILTTALGLLHSVICSAIGMTSSAYDSLRISTIAISSISLAGKMFSVRTKEWPQRLIDEHKLRTILPLVCNGSCLLTFLMICLCCPFKGFTKDLWLVLSSLSLLCLQWDRWVMSKLSSYNQTAPMLLVSIFILFVSAIFNSTFWELTLSLAVARGFFELCFILVTIPAYLLFTGFLWTGKMLLDEKSVVFVAPLHLVLLLLSSSSASIMLGVTGLSMSIWLMSFKFKLEKEIPAIR